MALPLERVVPRAVQRAEHWIELNVWRPARPSVAVVQPTLRRVAASIVRRTSSEEPDGFVAGRAICVFDPEAISFAISPTGIPPLP